MFSYLGRLAAVAAFAVPIVFGAPAHHLKIRNAAANDVVKDSWIVVYNEDVSAATISSHVESVASIISKRGSTHINTGIKATYSLDSFKGYNLIADAATIAAIADSPEVAYVEKDAKVYASTLISQSGAPWGLGRISHHTKGSTTYTYDSSAGSGITVYVIDTGVYAEHSEFGSPSRASMGANFVSDTPDTDENGHGTHCSGTIAGLTYGVAKSAKIVGVKVLDASGSGSNSGVISGIQWVTNNAPPHSVISMSLGGGSSSAVNSAVSAAVSAGVTVVVAAGNNNRDAKNYSPASEPSAITVAASDDTDAKASFSNFGTLVDIFAPGVDILSSWIGGTNATNTISGTSMATPHVAGLSAYLIALEGLSTPADVVARIQALATSGVITNPRGSKNLLAYNGNASNETLRRS